MENEAITKLLADSKAEMQVLNNQKKVITDKISKLNKIIQECEATIILMGKYKSVQNSGTDFATLIAEDNLRLMEAFQGDYKPLIQESINEVKKQINDVAIDLLKRDEAMGVKERTINEVATLLTEQGDLETANRIKQIALDGNIIEKL